MREFLALAAAAALVTPALADDTIVIDLAGITIQDGSSVTRSSSPDLLDASAQYSYSIDAMAQGTSGILGTLFPNPTPLGEILDTFLEGSSDQLEGEVCNAGGQLPFTVFDQRFEGSDIILGVPVSFGMDVVAGIDAGGEASFSITNVDISPSFLVGGMTITSGTATISALSCKVDVNQDCTVNTSDFIAFLNAYNAQLPLADWNNDTFINTADFISFLNDFTSGC